MPAFSPRMELLGILHRSCSKFNISQKHWFVKHLLAYQDVLYHEIGCCALDQKLYRQGDAESFLGLLSGPKVSYVRLVGLGLLQKVKKKSWNSLYLRFFRYLYMKTLSKSQYLRPIYDISKISE